MELIENLGLVVFASIVLAGDLLIRLIFWPARKDRFIGELSEQLSDSWPTEDLVSDSAETAQDKLPQRARGAKLGCFQK